MSSAAPVKVKNKKAVVLPPERGNGRDRSPGCSDHNHDLDRVFSQLGAPLIDLVLVMLATLVGFYLWSLWPSSAGTMHRGISPSSHPAILLVFAVLVVLILEVELIYRPTRALSVGRQVLLVANAVTVPSLLVIVVSYNLGVASIPWAFLCWTCGLNVLTLAGWRMWKRVYHHRRVADGKGLRNALIVGADREGQILARHLDSNPHLGYVVKGFVDPDSHTDPRLLGKIEDLGRVVSRHFIDDVFIAAPFERQLIDRLLWEARRQGFNVKLLPQCFLEMNGRINWTYVGDFATLTLHEQPIPALGLFIKRMLDIILSGLLLLVSSPLMLVIALAIHGSRGPVLYRSWRVGKKGRQFQCCKFRTMVDNAHELKEKLLHLNERNGPLFKISNDPRLTGIGGFLRKYSLDELPQLWNVLMGDMSLVGPRPALPEELEQYGLEHMRRLEVTPGLTGFWQVTARDDPSFDTYMALDLYYVANWSLGMDLRILLQTLPAVLRAEGR